jgi:hypothetical protein
MGSTALVVGELSCPNALKLRAIPMANNNLIFKGMLLKMFADGLYRSGAGLSDPCSIAWFGWRTAPRPKNWSCGSTSLARSHRNENWNREPAIGAARNTLHQKE